LSRRSPPSSFWEIESFKAGIRLAAVIVPTAPYELSSAV
jgi:hypothetical protein